MKNNKQGNQVNAPQTNNIAWKHKDENGVEKFTAVNAMTDEHLKNVLFNLGRNKDQRFINGYSRATLIIAIVEEQAHRANKKHWDEKNAAAGKIEDNDGSQAEKVIDGLKEIFPKLESSPAGFAEEETKAEAVA